MGHLSGIPLILLFYLCIAPFNHTKSSSLKSRQLLCRDGAREQLLEEAEKILELEKTLIDTTLDIVFSL